MSIYGLVIGIALLVLYFGFQKTTTVIPAAKLDSFFFGLLLSLLFGARIYHVIDQWPYYSQNLAQIADIRSGGLGIYGALITAFVYILIYTKIHRINPLTILNSISLWVPLAQSVGRWANFVNHEIPIWWLESLLCLGLFLSLTKTPLHYRFAFYLVGYGSIRIITEYQRYDTWQIGDYKIANIFSIIFILTGIIVYYGQAKIKIFSGHHQ